MSFADFLRANDPTGHWAATAATIAERPGDTARYVEADERDAEGLSIVDQDASSDLAHIYCCDPDTAMCGFHDPDGHWVDHVDPADQCVVCTDLAGGPCSASDCPDRVAA
jgi:hypothetical protein